MIDWKNLYSHFSLQGFNLALKICYNNGYNIASGKVHLASYTCPTNLKAGRLVKLLQTYQVESEAIRRHHHCHKVSTSVLLFAFNVVWKLSRFTVAYVISLVKIGAIIMHVYFFVYCQQLNLL